MKSSEFCRKLRGMTREELVLKERDLSEDMFRLRFQHGVRQLDNTAKIRELRRNIARVKMVIGEQRG